MAGINKVILVGHLGADPEVRRFQSGDQVAEFSIATSESWKDKNTGERKERIEWHRIKVLNNGLIENVIRPYVNKGSLVGIEGELQTEKWKDQQGNDRYATKIVVSAFRGSLYLLGGRDDNGDRGSRRRDDDRGSRSSGGYSGNDRNQSSGGYPAQRRLRTQLHAMQFVNMDGHKLDVFVKVPWSDTPVRMFLLGIQDLYSGKIVAWRLSDSENKETVRLVIGDMVENFGIPDGIVLDNGRAFASHWISGGTATRYRFKVKDEDPRGLLTTLGVEIHWTNPYSGQSKPIERAWRDLAEAIAKHPFCAGGYTGNTTANKPENYGTRAIPLDDFQMHVAAQITDHNAQAGRRAMNCAGRSFDETFAASIETAIIRQPTAAQKSLWLLASEILRAQKGNGEIRFQGNRYWNRALTQHAGKKVTIRFDPDNLHEAVKVYDLNNVLICDAECVEDTGFLDQDAARNHARARRDYMKGLKVAADAKRKLTAQQLGELIYKGEKVQKAPEPVRPKVTRIARGNLAVKEDAVADAISQEKFERGFARALSGIDSDPTVIQFPQGKHEPISSEYGSKKKGGINPAR